MSFTAMGIIQGIFLLFVLIGLLIGIWRGLGKSVIRIFTVLAMAVICFFTSPPIAKALSTTNISKLGITISGIHIKTVNDAIIQLLQKIKIVDELMASSPTFASFIESIPVLALNLVVFIVFYLVLLAFSHLFSWLIGKFTLKKHKKGEHKRFRLLGGLIGIVQAVLIFAVLAVPVFGVANTIEAAMKAMKTDNSSNTETASFVSDEEEQYVLVSEAGSEQNSTNSASSQFEKIEDAVEPYVKQFNKAPLTKAFKALGIATLENKVYGKLTTTKVNKEKVTLKNEIVILAKVSTKVNSVTKLSASSTEENFDDARYVIKTMFESKLFSRIAEETINHIATEWLDENDPTAFGIRRPNLGTTANELMDTVLLKLQNASRKTLENDLVQSINVMQKAKDFGILTNITSKSDTKDKDIMNSLATDGAVSSIIGVMTESETLRAIIPQVVKTGLTTIYSTVGVPKDEAELSDELALDIFKEVTDTDVTTREKMIQRLDLVTDRNTYDFSALILSGETDEEKTASMNANKQLLFGKLADVLMADMPTECDNEFKEKLNVTFTDELSNQTTYNLISAENCKRKTQKDLKITDNVTKEEWKNESIIVEAVFVSFVDAYNSTQDVPEGKDVFDYFDFDALGTVFDSMRHSILLDGREGEKVGVEDRTSYNIVKVLLQSDLMNGISVNTSFINIIRDNWTDPDFKFETAFETLGSTIKILSAFDADNVELDANDVKSLIEGLNSDSGEAIKDMLKDEILSSGSSDDSLVKAVTDIIDGIAEHGKDNLTEEEAHNETAALNTALDILDKANSDADSITVGDNEIDALMNSEIIYQSIIDATEDTSSEDSLGTKVQNAAQDNDELKANLEARYAAAETDAERAKINSIYNMFFGTNVPTE